ncbi:MAG: hypothetical protein GY847_41935 [Proteobacteria bacterium]|nr:hypothetical protein [Pseudomonadota bacterium]
MTKILPILSKPPRTHECATKPQIGFDDLDTSALVSIDGRVLGDTVPLAAAATAMANEGADGLAAIRRLCAREINLAKAYLRFREVAANVTLTRFIRGEDNRLSVDVAERAVERATVRLNVAINRLAKLDASPEVHLHALAAQIRIEARQ